MEPKALPVSPVSSSSTVILSLLMRRASSSASLSEFAGFAFGALGLEQIKALESGGRHFQREAAGHQEIARIAGALIFTTSASTPRYAIFSVRMISVVDMGKSGRLPWRVRGEVFTARRGRMSTMGRKIIEKTKEETWIARENTRRVEREALSSLILLPSSFPYSFSGSCKRAAIRRGSAALRRRHRGRGGRS